MKIASFFLSVVLLFSVYSFGYSQTLVQDTTQLKVLVFEHLEKGKKKLISQGAIIRYKLQSNPKVWIKGQLEQIDPTHMTVSGQRVAYADCMLIAGRVHSERDILGGVAMGVGGASFLFGTALLGNLPLGSGFIAGGAVALVTGVILITRFKRFHFDKGWTVHPGTITYNRV